MTGARRPWIEPGAAWFHGSFNSGGFRRSSGRAYFASNTRSLMDMLLSKKRAGDRKAWLETKGDLASLEV